MENDPRELYPAGFHRYYGPMKKSLFDEIIDRRGSGSIKWELTEKLYGSSDVLPMWVADMDFPAPGPVIRALTERVEHPVYGYTGADDATVNAVLSRMRRLYNWPLVENDVIFTPGVVPAVTVAVRACTEPGDGVLVMPPVYPPFFSLVREEGRRVVESPLRCTEDGRWEIDYEDLENKARDAKMLLLCSPHNPVGRVWTREELESLVQIASRYELTLVSDEIHGEIVYPENQHTPLASLSEEARQRTISCIAASKTFNVAGLATSVTIIEDPALRRTFTKSLGSITGHPNLFGLCALRAAFTDCDEWLAELVEYLDANRRLTADFLAAGCPGIRANLPEAGFLSWLDCREMEMDDSELARFFAREARVGLNSGASFGTGGSGFMRLNFAAPRTLLEEGLGRIKEALSRG
ncbi:hypothetical protein B4O97_07105 [Marispirochaeta aestuarii]|uniref:cysteine-S-conjugate beta-lyase n=1 Tax=Marispirochaeta aestuarii TaxID=1963862 RepID=A0A1Y1S115_9SPIO|nr:PatB family C-S lyase [Marispirochaeta aestuarii]ORC36350.1 hypothetical protein B4O97_07105 [Marispirochaeta aestuarii]